MRQAFAFFCLLLLTAAPARAAHWDKFFRLCPEEIVIPPELIPVGCEVVDCCPGCPGPPEWIDWRILVEKQFARGVEISLEGLDERALAGLKFRGNVKRDGNRIFAGPGESFISGLPNAKKGRVAVGMVKIVPDAERIRARNAQDADADAAPAKRDDEDMGVSIQQLAGKFVVNTFRTRWKFIPCGPVLAIEDRIRLTSNTSSDSAVILADYRRSTGCRNDVIHRTSTTRTIGNALTNGACNSEVSVFSDDNAMSFQTGVTTWTNAAGDTHTVNLQPMLTAPVTVWIAMAGALPRAQNDMANANLLYNTNNVGVRFNATFNDVSGNPAAVTAIGTGCANAGGLAGTAFHTANTINLYYVDGAFTGVNCAANRNVNYIGTTANLGSAPHEIGHAYGLRPSGSGGHTNDLPGFGNNNIMWGGGPGTRNHFSVGQAFRINVSDISRLNLNGTRTGGTRTCAPNSVSNLCPELALDSTPH